MNKIISFFFIFIIIIWQPLQLFVLKVDGAGWTLVIATIFYLFIKFLNNNISEFYNHKIIFVYLIWFIYNYFNTILHGYSGQSLIIFIFILLWPILVMELSQKSVSTNNHRFIINSLLVSLITYFIIILIFNGFSINEFRSISLINTNKIGSYALLLLFTVLYQNYIFKSNKILLFLTISLSMMIIIATASRKYFAASLIIILPFIFQLNKKYSLSFKVFFTTFFVSSLYFLVDFISTSTTLGKRLLSTSTQTQLDEMKTNTFLDLLGDRGYQYFEGYYVFLENNPIFGIGLKNFQFYGFYKLDLHSEYLVNLVEGGILSFIIIMVFYFKIWRYLIKVRRIKINYELTNFLIFNLLAILFINFSAWTYDNIPIFIILGIIIGHCDKLFKTKFE